MRKIKHDATGAAHCPKCGGSSFIGKSTLKGKLAGGFLFAPKRARCVSCGEISKMG